MPFAHCPAPIEPDHASRRARQAPDMVVQVPAPLRAVLLEWSEPCDPALALLGAADAAAMRARLVDLGQRPGRRRVGCRDLLLLYRLARLNQQFGLVAPLRQQGGQVGAWVAAAFSASARQVA
jgi:hypothetical protein